MLKMGGNGTKNGKPIQLMLIGLSHKNLKELKKGRPIKTDSAAFGLTGDMEIFIFSGETEQSMLRDMHELVGPDTEIHIDPQFKD